MVRTRKRDYASSKTTNRKRQRARPNLPSAPLTPSAGHFPFRALIDNNTIRVSVSICIVILGNRYSQILTRQRRQSFLSVTSLPQRCSCPVGRLYRVYMCAATLNQAGWFQSPTPVHFLKYLTAYTKIQIQQTTIPERMTSLDGSNLTRFTDYLRPLRHP